MTDMTDRIERILSAAKVTETHHTLAEKILRAVAKPTDEMRRAAIRCEERHIAEKRDPPDFDDYFAAMMRAAIGDDGGPSRWPT